jgi:S1-C subfamily serine protease
MSQEPTTPEGSPIIEPAATPAPVEEPRAALSTLTDDLPTEGPQPQDGTTEMPSRATPPSAGSPTPPASPSAPPTPVSPSGAGRLPGWLVLLIAVVLVVASSGITYLVATDRPADTQTAAGEQPSTESGTPGLTSGEEPVAAAAGVILPSVVQIQSSSGVGSGVIYDSDGLILTAAHVVAGEQTVTVRLNDGEDVEGTVIGGTPGADVAVVQVDRTGLPAAELALDGDPEVGQLAIAVGSPWGLQGTVTAGIISAVDQSIPSGGSARAVLQTDAAINPGNSGGPLVDRQGRVLGINVSIFSLSGANDGVGFAVPIDVAHNIAERLVSGESIVSAFLGVIGQNAESGQAGALITEVTPDSGADDAGIEVGDLVTTLAGVRVEGIADLAAQVQTHSAGDTVEVVIVRDGREQTLNVTFGERPADVG